MSEQLRLSRAQLAAALGNNHDTIVQFEKLMYLASVLTPDYIDILLGLINRLPPGGDHFGGEQGESGVPGINGRDGRDGQTGVPGSDGRDGGDSLIIIPSSTISVVDAAADTTTWVMLAGNQTGEQPALTDGALTYNANTDTLGVLAITATGPVSGLNLNVYFTSTGSLTAAQVAGTVVSNYGMTDADCTTTLPAAAEGYAFTAILPAVRARFVKFKAATNDKIYLLGVAGADNANVGVASGYATGSCCNFFSFKASDGNYDWFAVPVFGTWVAS